jgi:hypothetical protein
MTTWEEVPLPDEFLPKPGPKEITTGWTVTVSASTDPVVSVSFETLLSFRPTTLLPEPVQGELFE